MSLLCTMRSVIQLEVSNPVSCVALLIVVSDGVRFVLP
jgi:hypothetical protein